MPVIAFWSANLRYCNRSPSSVETLILNVIMAKRFALRLLGLFLWSTVAAAQIPESPFNQTVPVNSVARFTCRAEGLVVWQINNTQLLSDEIVNQFRVEIRIDSDNRSMLLVNATMENNGTRIHCLNGTRFTNLGVMGTAFLIVFVHPDPPYNLTLLSVEPFTLSWIPPFALPGVAIRYFLNVANLNTTEVSQSGELSTTSFNFTATEGSSPCDVYQFTVTANNAAGWSDPSPPLTASLPSLPGMVSDVNLRVEVSGDDIRIKITLEPARSCIGYPVTHYHLAIESSSTNQPVMRLGPYFPMESTDVSRINILLNSSDNIYQNVRYHFQVIAVNSVGESISPGMEFYTTDVQLAEVQFHVNRTVIVRCHFAEGSLALGCNVLLSFFNSSQSLNISRVNESFVEQEVATHFPVHCNQSQISVYDWEADGTIGALPISVETSFSNESCGTVNIVDVDTRATPISTSEVPAAGFNIVPTAAGVGAAGGVLLIAVLVLIVTVVAIHTKRARRKREPLKQDLEDGDCPKNSTQNNRGLTLPIPPEQLAAHEMVVYDTPMLVKRPGEGIEGEKDYNILHLSSQSLHRISPTPHTDENERLYSQLHQGPEYAVLEKPVPEPVSPPRSSASPSPPPPPSVPPPPSIPPPPPTSTIPPPPLYHEIVDLPQTSVLENRYTEISSAGTTIY